MPEEPNSPDNATPADAASAFTDADWTDDNWTDDSSYETLEDPAVSPQTETSSTVDEWDSASLEWEDELTDPPEAVPQATTTQEALVWIQPTWRRLQRLWGRLIAGVRSRIPAAANLSDAGLSAILIGILVVLLIIFSGVRQPAVARNPAAPSPATALDQPSPVADLPAPLDSEAPPESVPSPTAPAPSAATSAAEPVVPIASDRIAQIQAQLTDSSILNAQRVIDSVEADLVNNRLTLVLNGDWYRLSEYDQTQLAQALMAQSKELSFADLQFQTAAGDLVARSPVVGHNMVILQHERPPAVPMPERPRYRITIDR